MEAVNKVSPQRIRKQKNTFLTSSVASEFKDRVKRAQYFVMAVEYIAQVSYVEVWLSSWEKLPDKMNYILVLEAFKNSHREAKSLNGEYLHTFH